VDKAPDAFRTISEVAEDLDLPQHVLRFWETRFPQIKPLKRGGGRRYYRPDDVMLLKGIRHLLYGEGYTIKGVQRIIREQGARHIMNLWHDSQNEAISDAPIPASHQAFAPPVVRGEPDAVSHHTQAWAIEREHGLAPTADDGDYPHDGMIDADVAVLPPPISAAAPSEALQHTAARAASPNPIARDDLRRLQATLYELMECKRILEGAR
jgi:DNA-binding transcriptional MerR regulator